MKKHKNSINFEITKSTDQNFENFVDYFDPEIFKFIVVLNNLGFRTFSSCQGHIKETGSPTFYPYVVFCEKELDNIYQEGNSDKITEEYIYQKYSFIMQEEERLLEYLNKFYLNRDTIMRNRLVIKTNNFLRFSIQPLFADFADTITDIKEQERLNKIYLKEVHDFTEFLESNIL
jgi:hypothetical protein